MGNCRLRFSWFFLLGGPIGLFQTSHDLFSASLNLAIIAHSIAGFGYWTRSLRASIAPGITHDNTKAL